MSQPRREPAPDQRLHSPGRAGRMGPARRLPKAAGKVHAVTMEADGFIYDTHAAVRRLTDAGFSERQAEAVVRGQVRIFERNLATKDDIEALRAATKTDIATAKTSIILWIASLNAAMLGILLLAMAWTVDTLLKAQ